MSIRRVLQLAILTVMLGMAPMMSLGQDADMLRHFDYDQKAPLNLKQIGVQRRATATVYDITYASPIAGAVPAYLVVPKGRGPFAAVIWGHWYWGNSSMRNRKQFLDEAIVLAQAGVVSLLTDGPIARPGHVESKEPLNEQDALDFRQQAIDMRRGVDLLLSRRDVDPHRIAFVGHSYNASIGALLSGVDRRFKCFVLMAGTMSDEVSRQGKDYQEFRQKVGPEKLDALVAKYSYLDQGKYVAHAAPAFVFLQFANQEQSLTPEVARRHAAIVSEPKLVRFYEAPHALNAEARRDRIHFLIEQLKLRPISDSAIAGIPNLYQPPQ